MDTVQVGGFAKPARQLVDAARFGEGDRQRAGIICRPSLPRNTNGKALKRELRQGLADLVY